MGRDVGLTATVFGNGVGLMFFCYALFEVPSNVLLARIGARATLTRIAVAWGIVTILMALVTGPLSFYGLRALLGAAESGLFPGVMLFISLWFPFAYRAQYNAMFNYAVPLSYVFASIISGYLLELDGVLGLTGWQWLFIIEGLPAIGLGVFGAFYLTDRPEQAGWLPAPEKAWLVAELARDAHPLALVDEPSLWRSLVNPVVLLLGVCNFGLFCGLASLPYWLPQIVRGFHLPFGQVGLVTAIPPLAGLVGMIVLSRRSDRKRERFGHCVFAMLLAALGFLVVAVSTAPAMVIGGFMVANIGVYSTQAIFWTIPQTFLSRRIAPGAIGLIGTMGSIGGALIPVIIGRLRDSMGNFTGGFLTVAGVFVAAAGVVVVTGWRLQRGMVAESVVV